MSDSPSPLADPHVVFDPTEDRRDVVVLGSTGSIGTQAIDLVLRNPDRFRVTGLSAAGGRGGPRAPTPPTPAPTPRTAPTRRTHTPSPRNHHP
ncbi:hypothetical protein ACFXN4_12675, partial [Streptomyces sp. NPDC059176]